MRSRFPLCALAIAALALAAPVSASSCTATSGAKRVTVVELYTSEGCDSCPTADRWLSTLKTRNDVVPLAFHVDYWDYIGWKDPYAQKSFTERQRVRVAAQNSRSVYTPQVMMNGQDFTTWRNPRGAPEAFRSLGALSAPIELKLTASAQPTTIKVNIETLDGQAGTRLDRKDTVYTAALYEHNLVSNVTAGENRGVTLRHDFVVRALQRSPNKSFNLPFSKEAVPANLGVAIIAETATGEFLQAVKLDLGGC
jgi:hypothetical protein